MWVTRVGFTASSTAFLAQGRGTDGEATPCRRHAQPGSRSASLTRLVMPHVRGGRGEPGDEPSGSGCQPRSGLDTARAGVVQRAAVSSGSASATV